MAEPVGTKFPSDYDDNDTLLGNLVDQRNFQLKTGVDNDDQTIEVEGSLADIDLPVYIRWGDGTGEITYCDEINGAKTAFLNVIRGARGTTGVSHSVGADFYLAVMGIQFYLFMDAILAAEKYQALVKTSSPGTCSVGEALIRSDEDKAYECVEDNAWLHVGRTDHDELEDLDADDHDTGANAYHNDYRAKQWHDGLDGGHVDDGDDHDHSVGAGPKRIYGGASLPGSPTYEREYFYDETNDILYISKDTSNWVKITGAPQGAIMMISEETADYYGGACPPGWSRFTALDERIPVGAPSEKPPGLGNVGSDIHTHTYSTVIEHTHPVPSFAAEVADRTINHTHTVPAQSPGGSGLCLSTGSAGGSSFVSTDNGNHAHAFNVPSNTTNATYRSSDDEPGVSEGTTENGSSLPPYHTVIFCKKD